MTETWCGVLLFVLVPLVTGLNAALLRQVASLRGDVEAVKNGAGSTEPTG